MFGARRCPASANRVQKFPPVVVLANLSNLRGYLSAQRVECPPRRIAKNRGGDRQANRALHLTVVGRIRLDPKTQAYEGHSKLEAIGCPKRCLARKIYYLLSPGQQSITLNIRQYRKAA